MPNARIVALSAHEKKPDTFEVASPIADQLAFLRERIERHGMRSLISYPTNLAQLSGHLLDSERTVPELQRIVCMSELFEPSQEALIRRAFPNARIAAKRAAAEAELESARRAAADQVSGAVATVTGRAARLVLGRDADPNVIRQAVDRSMNGARS